MNQEKFIEHISHTYEQGIELIRRKNNDYAGSNDPFKNFRAADIIGIGVERAILVRMSDKLARIGNILGKEANVKDESIEDTLLDLINYTAILKAYLYDKKQQEPPTL